MWPNVTELKASMLKEGDVPGFVVRLWSPARDKAGARIKGYDELVFSGPLDRDLFDRLKALTVELFIEQGRRANPTESAPAETSG